MKGWDLMLDPRAPSPTPLFVRIARALEEDIRRGRLPPGAPLPGSRTLAESLGVHRNTVLAAYRELETQGWIVTSAARATYVSPTLPDVPARSSAGAPRETLPTQVGFPLPATPPRRERFEPSRRTLVLAGGVPAVRLVPPGLPPRACAPGSPTCALPCAGSPLARTICSSPGAARGRWIWWRAPW